MAIYEIKPSLRFLFDIRVRDFQGSQHDFIRLTGVLPSQGLQLVGSENMDTQKIIDAEEVQVIIQTLINIIEGGGSLDFDQSKLLDYLQNNSNGERKD